MKSSAKKVELASVDDLFSTEESRADAQREKVVEIPLSELYNIITMDKRIDKCIQFGTGRTKDYLRITIGTEEQMETLYAALRAYFQR